MKRSFKLKTKLFAVLFVFAFLLAAGWPKETVQADTSRVVRIGYFDYGRMCRGAEEGVTKSGYVYDFMQKIASYAGWTYEYTYGTYAELYELLMEGKIDILPYTNWNEQRSKEVLFSDDPVIEEKYYIATRSDDERFAGGDIKSLDGMTVATVTGADQNNLLINLIKENNLAVKLTYFGEPEASWDALKAGNADAAVFSNISYREGDAWNILCSFGSKPTYIAVNKQAEEILSELNTAYELMIDTNPQFISQLQATVTAGNPAMLTLSENEKAWLKKHPTICVGYLRNPNLKDVVKNEEGDYVGLHAEMISRYLSFVDKALHFEYFGYDTPDELGDALLRHEVDIAGPFYPSSSYAEKYGFAITNTALENSMALVYNKKVDPGRAMKKVAVLSYSLANYYMEQNYPDSEVVIVDSIPQAVNLLRTKKITGIVAEKSDTGSTVQTYGDLLEQSLNSSCETCFAANIYESSAVVILNRGISITPASEITAMVANNKLAPEIDFYEYIVTHPAMLILFILVPMFIIVLVLALGIVMKLRKEAQAASEAKTKFLFNMSHDIRTPMNAILGYTDIALRHKDEQERVVDSLKKIKTSGGHLLNLINDILEMSRIESDKLVLAENPLDLRDVIECVDQMSQSLAIPKSIDYQTVTGYIKNPYVLSDELHVNEVLINLVSNSVKYTQEGGEVRLFAEQISEAENGKAQYRFTIKDTGIGMSEEFQQHLFENFSRENTATVSRQEGAGLGLSIVKKIIDIAGGTIQVHSKQGEGSVFTVMLPMKVMDDAAIKAYQEEQKSYALTEKDVDLENRTVLLVEDNEMNREIATEILMEAGMNVESAEDGSIAVQMVKEKGTEYYDIILMDIQMPVMNGYEATTEIRKLPDGNKVPIIALSANAFKEDVEKSLSYGMNAHVAKPIDIKALVATMCSLIKD